MNGEITLQSTPGNGALFHIELPLVEGSPADVLPSAGNYREVIGVEASQPDFRVLIVEDQVENQLLLGQLMEAVGISCRVVGNGQEGVKAFREWQPDLIWMDQRMPVMDGMAATRLIRQLPGGDKVKIVAVTASAFRDQREEMLSAGMDDFICKPYRADELYACLTRNLGLRFIYEQDDADVAGQTDALSQEQLALLPQVLRDELAAALESLENQRIAGAIRKVSEHDRNLAAILSRMADSFDYPPILALLRK